MNSSAVLPNIIAVLASALLNLFFYTQYLAGMTNRKANRKPAGIVSRLQWSISQFYFLIAVGLFLLPFFPKLVSLGLEGISYPLNSDVLYMTILPSYIFLFGGYWLLRRRNR